MELAELIDGLNRRNKALWHAIRKRENLETFKNLWSRDASLYKFYDLYKKVRSDMGVEPKSFDHFDKQWQVYLVLAVKFKDALNEWAELLVQ